VKVLSNVFTYTDSDEAHDTPLTLVAASPLQIGDDEKEENKRLAANIMNKQRGRIRGEIWQKDGSWRVIYR
jgi:hypothetical protein